MKISTDSDYGDFIIEEEVNLCNNGKYCQFCGKKIEIDY